MGAKAIKPTDRVTVHMSNDADGSDEVPIAIIETDKNPRAFSLEALALSNCNNSTAWLNGPRFRKFFMLVSLRNERKALLKRSLSFLTAHHRTQKMPDPQCQLDVLLIYLR